MVEQTQFSRILWTINKTKDGQYSVIARIEADKLYMGMFTSDSLDEAKAKSLLSAAKHYSLLKGIKK